MDERILRVLEFDKIRARFAEYTASEMGRARAFAIVPAVEPAAVRALQSQTLEAEALYRRLGQNPVTPFTDTRDCLKRSRAALALTPKELLHIGEGARSARLARESLVKAESGPLLRNMAAGISPHRVLEEEIARCIFSEEEIADAASPKLAQVRRQIRLAHERVREKLNSFLHSSVFSKYLQEPIITIRHDRYVLPIKQEARQFVPGILHDQSGTGATLFIEPMAVVEIGNDIKRLQLDEQAEVDRVLAELTALIRPAADELIHNLELLAELDVIFAKAAFARDLRAVAPGMNTQGHIRIARGRHPLIDQEKVIPTDLWLGKDFTTLIVTGPNTGGKTVTLKTVGLFTLMAQAGLMIPAEGCELSVYKQVYADIGDEQSIEQSLSTFSSHMKNIVGVLEDADENSLVLLDELGAGTDPNEGAALAMAILETLAARGCTTLATTHYSELKAFALTRAGMENASMEFDVSTLAPTYRLFIGIPGRSNAFEISSRLGLDGGVIERARQFLKHEDVQFEEVIASAQTQRQEAERERTLAIEARQEIDRLRAEAEAEREKLAARREQLIQKAKEEARGIIRKAKDESDRVIRDLRLMHAGAPDREVQKARDALRRQENEILPSLERRREDGEPPKDVRPGQTVYVTTLGQNATVLNRPNKGDVMIQAGIMKLSAKLSDLREVEEARVHTDASGARLLEKQVGFELDLRGKTLEEALLEADYFIDNAITGGLSEICLIHGKGTGTLRAGIAEYLKRDKRVKTFRLGRYGEGETGVTIVTI